MDSGDGDSIDPRAELWRYTRNERETWHDHGSFPRADSYNFYLSYHSMFVVAANLLETMPVVHGRDWCDDEWAEWLGRHLLTRNDGLWLADRRDPPPLLREDCIQWKEKTIETWRTEITTDDFLQGILLSRKGETWLNVSGSWTNGDSECVERFSVSTALVSPKASQALLYALTTCSNPYDFKIPDYQEEDMEFESDPFVLKGWVWQEGTVKRLDEHDPHASQIIFPPFRIGESIMNLLGLSVDTEQREWFLSNTTKATIHCELWSTNTSDRNEEPLRLGNRLSASLDLLRKLCELAGADLIIKVTIDRERRYKSYSRRDDEIGYQLPLHKVYILSADGKLRDTETYFELR